MKCVANESSFVLTAREAWGCRPIPSKDSLCNRDDGMIYYMKDNGKQMLHVKHRLLHRGVKRADCEQSFEGNFVLNAVWITCVEQRLGLQTLANKGMFLYIWYLTFFKIR